MNTIIVYMQIISPMNRLAYETSENCESAHHNILELRGSHQMFCFQL